MASEKNKRSECIATRRNKMVCRYYFHAEIRRLRYDDCLMNLHREFDLMPDTIVKELQKNTDYLYELKQHKTTTSELRKLYPYFNWAASLV